MDTVLFIRIVSAILLQSSMPETTPYAPKTLAPVDGDTIKADGVNMRIFNLDAPERGARSECDAEWFLAAVAGRRAERLLASDNVVVWPEARAGRYGRPLVRVTVQGQDRAEIMIAESLAVAWTGRRHDWCG